MVEEKNQNDSLKANDKKLIKKVIIHESYRLLNIMAAIILILYLVNLPSLSKIPKLVLAILFFVIGLGLRWYYEKKW
ncbi:MAG: hypothetical protein ABIF88_02810 [archaeon]